MILFLLRFHKTHLQCIREIMLQVQRLYDSSTNRINPSIDSSCNCSNHQHNHMFSITTSKIAVKCPKNAVSIMNHHSKVSASAQSLSVAKSTNDESPNIV